MPVDPHTARVWTAARLVSVIVAMTSFAPFADVMLGFRKCKLRPGARNGFAELVRERHIRSRRTGAPHAQYTAQSTIRKFGSPAQEP
jgi:hypothetical protein